MKYAGALQRLHRDYGRAAPDAERPTGRVCGQRAAVPRGWAWVGVPCPCWGSPGTCGAMVGRPGPLPTVGRLPSPSPLQDRLSKRRRSWARGAAHGGGGLGASWGLNELLSARQVLAEPWGSSYLLSRMPRDPITCGSSRGQGTAGAGSQAPKPREDGPLFQVSRQVRDGPASWLRKRLGQGSADLFRTHPESGHHPALPATGSGPPASSAGKQ